MTSVLIPNVFAFSATGDIALDGVTTENTYVIGIPYLPIYNTTFPPKRITVIFIDEEIAGFTYGLTVRDALFDLGIPVDESLVVLPETDAMVTDGMSIELNSITLQRVFESENIPFESISYTDDTIEIDTSTIVQAGIEGERRVVYEYEYRDGVLSSKTLIREDVIVPPQDEIVAVGSKKVFKPMTVGNDTFEYWKILNVFATSYDKNCKGCNEWTATGKFLEKGICAVDPKVIPLHSHFYVPGYGFCAAEDVGGAIKGNRIDLGFYDFANHQGEWSARYVDIYLLD